MSAADGWIRQAFRDLAREKRALVRADDRSVHAILGRIAIRIVAAHTRAVCSQQNDALYASDSDVCPTISALLDLLDVETALNADPDNLNLRRDLLIFKLHFVECLTPQQIESIQSLDLPPSSVEIILNHLRKRLRPRTVE